MKYVNGKLVPLTEADLAQHEAIQQLPPVIIGKVWTPLQFMEEFTFEERTALRALAKGDPLAEDWLYLLQAAGEVRAEDSRTVSGLRYMAYKGVLTDARVNAILNV